jgi:hypothetical protein
MEGLSMKFFKTAAVWMLALAVTSRVYGAGTVFDATKAGDVTVVAKYIENLGVNVNIADSSGRTPLSYACELKDPTMARYLLAKGANPNVMDKLGRTPLVYAVLTHNGNLVGLLISQNADVAVPIQGAVREIKSPLTLFELALYTTLADHRDAFQSVFIVRQLKDAFRARKLVIDAAKTASNIKALARYPLFREILFGTLDGVKRVVQAGVGVDVSDPISPTTAAVLFDRPEIFAYFLNAGFVEKPFSQVVSVALRTGLGYSVLDFLWPTISPVDIATYAGETDEALFADALASAYSSAFIKYLFAKHFDFSWIDGSGATLIGAAIAQSQFGLAQDLISRGALPDLATIQSINALSGKSWDDEERQRYMNFLRFLMGKHVPVNNPDGVISVVAGGSQPGFSGDSGPAATAQLNEPKGIAIDTAGNLYVSDRGNNVVRKITTNGIIITLAGSGKEGYNGDGGPAISARLDSPDGVAMDSAGNLYIVDTGNSCVRKVDASGRITTVAGQGPKYDGDFGGYSGDGGSAVSAKLHFPKGISIDLAGNLYIADTDNNRIRKVDAEGKITTVAGSGPKGYGGDDGPAISAQLSAPSGVAVDPMGNLYIADTDNRRIRKVDTRGIITTVAGNGTEGSESDGCPAVAALLNFTSGIALDMVGNLYIAEGRIRRVDQTGTITTAAGNGQEAGDKGGPAILANVSAAAVTVDGTGTIYFSDGASRVWRVKYPQAP